MLFYCYYYFCQFKIVKITINWCILCNWCTEGKSSRSEASFRDCMTHIVLSIKKPSARRPILLQDRAAVPPRTTRGSCGPRFPLTLLGCHESVFALPFELSPGTDTDCRELLTAQKTMKWCAYHVTWAFHTFHALIYTFNLIYAITNTFSASSAISSN